MKNSSSFHYICKKNNVVQVGFSYIPDNLFTRLIDVPIKYLYIIWVFIIYMGHVPILIPRVGILKYFGKPLTRLHIIIGFKLNQ